MGADLILRADSATTLNADFADAVLVCGSHGGLYPGSLALAAGCRGAIFHDAGVGCDCAGLASLDLLEAYEVPAAAVWHMSARIGDSDDVWRRGRISAVNAPALDLGCNVGQPAAEVARKLARGLPRGPIMTDIVERRRLVGGSETMPAWAIDSASQVLNSDRGAILLTGSHGGLLGGRPESALRADARVAVFNDAGVGIEDAGIGRLAALEDRGIAAATVASSSARIGDGLSTYEDGVISYCNKSAQELGARVGQSVKELVGLLLGKQ